MYKVGDVKPSDHPEYVRSVTNCNFSFAIPQKYINDLSEENMKLLKAINVLSKLISSQRTTFRAASVAKLSEQIDKQCETVFEIMESFLIQYNKMYAMYVCSTIVITNMGEIKEIFSSLINCHKNFENLIKKIKDETIKIRWQKQIKTVNIQQVLGNAEVSSEFVGMILSGIISPIHVCSAKIVACENNLKESTRLAQAALEEKIKELKDQKNEIKDRLLKNLNLCEDRVKKTEEEAKKKKKLQQEKDNKKKKNGKLLGQQIEQPIKEIEYIKLKMKNAKARLNDAMRDADEALKIAKYGVGNHVGTLRNLKSFLKKMVAYAKEVFEIMNNPKTTEEERKGKINDNTKEIKQCEKDINTMIKEIKLEEIEYNVGKHRYESEGKLDAALIKILSLEDNKQVKELYKVITNWSKAKPNALIAFVKKYGKAIIMGLGVIAAL